LGDGVATIPALYLITRARQLGASNSVIARMIVNFFLDVSIGAVPVIGDLFDVGFKSNRRNIALLQAHMQSRARRETAPKVAHISDAKPTGNREHHASLGRREGLRFRPSA
jgi:hypothetical protein